MFQRNRHNVTMRADFFRPLPVKSEAVTDIETHSASTGIMLLDADAGVEAPLIIDESERLLSADELYREALEGEQVEVTVKTTRSRSAPISQPRMQLWGAGTSGIPRRGSRTIRLFRAEPEQVEIGIREASGQGQLELGWYEHKTVLDESELHARGRLYGSFRLRPQVPVDVSVRIARFNGTFAAVELKLESNRHPRLFFRAAHDAIEALDLPGR